MAEAGLDAVPINLAQRGVLATNDFPVLEFQRVGVARLRDGINFGPLRKFIEDRMQTREAEIAEVADFQAKAGQGVGHDGAVAAQLGELVNQLNVGAFARRGGEAVGVLGNGGEPLVFIRTLAFVHDVKDFVHETVEAEEGVKAAELRRGRLQPGSATGA